jgi:YegS/Rv2252/BmrU family lipid kinase
VADIFVVLNPVAGNARPERVYPALSRYLAPGSYEVYETTGEEDLPALVRERLAQGFDTFVAIGGDGTVGAVAAGLVGSLARLAIVPAGTSNLLAHDAGIPERLDDALALVVGGASIMRLDAMQLGEMYAFLNVSLGLSVGVLRDADPETKRKLGRLAYIWSGLKNLAAVGVQTVRLQVDGKPYELRASEVLVTNCPSLGAPELSLSSEIHMDDGRIEVITFRTRHLADYWGILLDLLLRRPRQRRNVRTFEVFSQVAIETDAPAQVQVDGDLIGVTPVTVQVAPGAVRLIAPRMGH